MKLASKECDQLRQFGEPNDSSGYYGLLQMEKREFSDARHHLTGNSKVMKTGIQALDGYKVAPASLIVSGH